MAAIGAPIGRVHSGFLSSTGLVEHQIRLVVVAQENLLTDPAGIGVFRHKPLPAGVDEDPAGHQLRVAHDHDLGGVHVREIGPKGLGHADGRAIMLLHAGRRRRAGAWAATMSSL